LAGIEGSLRYNYGAHQYSQAEMWLMAFGLIPGLFYNRIRHGRFLDIFVTHAPPWGIHDMDDLPHRGIKAFRWLLKVFSPAYHLHGHIHVYRNNTKTETRFYNTTVVNCFGYRELALKRNSPSFSLPEVEL
ncbi:MAG: metallophosphoesterase, partial [Chloroflexota bacterium]